MAAQYIIQKQNRVNFDTIEKAPIDKTVWLHTYKPLCYAQIVYDLSREAFVARLTCHESNPLTRFTNFYDFVYKDSCLEWFACFDPVDGRYVNFEMNSNGALLSAIGAERNNRVRLDELIRVEELPPVVADKTATKWSVTITVSKAILEKIYGHPLSFKSGFACKGNLYKCGDETPVEHYVMWNPVETKQPDYHVPAFFGDFIMG